MIEDKECIKEKKSDKKIAVRVSIVTIIGNIMLSIFKIVAGIVGNSSAMISDAVHSVSDVFSSFIVIIGFEFASKESDEEHPYGHERLESVAAIILSIILLATGFGIGLGGIKKIIIGQYDSLVIPKTLALIAAVISLLVKELMYRYTKAAADKINSGALMADAWHHRSDALSSIGAFIGILGSKMGFPVLDSVASVVISLFIIKVAYDIFKDAINKMLDKSTAPHIEKKMMEITMAQEGVMDIHNFRSRLFGAKIYVDIEIIVNGNKTLKYAYEISEQVHNAIENEFKDVKHCMVYVIPDQEK